MILQNYMGGALIVTALILSGCGGGNKLEVGPVEKSALIEQVEAFKADDIDLTSFGQALEYMGLDEEEAYSWDSKNRAKGRVTYTNLILPDERGTIGRLEISGAHLQDGNPLFQVIEVENLEYLNVLGKPITSIRKARLNVSQDLKDNIVNNVGYLEVDSLFDDIDYLDWEPLSSGGGYVEGLSLQNRQLTVDVEFLGWAPEAEDRHISFLVDDLTIKPQWRYEDTGALNLTLDHISASGFDTVGLDSNSYEDYNIYNVFDPGYQSVVVTGFDASVDTFKIKLSEYRSGLTGDPEGEYVYETDMPSLTVAFDEEPYNYSLTTLWEMFDATGLDSVDFSHKARINLDVVADTAKSEYFDIGMKDAFDLKLDFDVTGYNGYISELINYSMILIDEDVDYSDLIDKLEAQEEKVSLAGAGLDLNVFDMVLTDTNGIEKVFASMAKTQDVSVDVARQQAKAYAMMMTLGLDNDFQRELAQDFAESAQSFIEEGGRLKLSVSPEEDFSLGEAMAQYETFNSGGESEYADAIEDGLSDKSDLSGSIKDLDAEEPQSLKDIFDGLNIDFEHIGPGK